MTVVDDARALVARTATAQGITETVADPAVLAKVATILTTRNGNGAPKGAGTSSHTTATLTRGGCRGPE